MRIDAYNQISQLYQTTKVKQTQGVKKNTPSDAFEISQAGRDYQTVVSAVKEASDIREDKVNKIKRRAGSNSANWGFRTKKTRGSYQHWNGAKS